MSRHSTRWEDAGYAGLECDGQDAEFTLDAENREPVACPKCGTKIRLDWIVRVMEIGPDGRERPSE